MSNHGSADDKGNSESFCQSTFSTKMQRGLREMKKRIQKITDTTTSVLPDYVFVENTQEEDKYPLYVFPEQLSILTWRTGFSKNEIRKLYRAFKQFCPRGCATINCLKPVYSKLFPLGDSSKYMQMVFNNFDKDNDGIISFSDLLEEMALIVNGNMDQKLSWIFGFYDLNGDGCITKPEILAIISAIHEMVQNAQIIQPVINSQVDRFFEKMDADRDGVVSKEEFMSGCKNV